MTADSVNHNNKNNSDNADNNGDQNMDRGPIVSALLTFAVAIYRNASHDRIIQLLMSEFSIEEIMQSKHILCDVSKVPYQNRNSSNLRTEKTAHTADICNILRTLDNDNMPFFVMDRVSFARLPRINAEDVSYIAVASRIAETNARLDLMNSLISENTARCLQNEERVQYLARQKNNNASYSNVVNGSDKSSQLHQASSNVPGPRQSASKFKLGGITDAQPSDPFKMAKPPSNPPKLPLGHIPLRSLLAKTSSSTSQTTKADTGGTQTDGVPAQNDAASSIANGVQSDNNALTKQHTESKPSEGLGPEPDNPGQSATKDNQSNLDHTSNHVPTSLHGSTSNLHRSSSQVSLISLSGHSEKWKHVTHNRPKVVDALRGSRRLRGTATSNKVSGTSDPHGYLFISRVSRDTRDEDMLEWIENLNVNIIDFTRASHNEARSKSFVLTVNIREYHRLINPDLWHANIQISRYIVPKAQREIVA